MSIGMARRRHILIPIDNFKLYLKFSICSSTEIAKNSNNGSGCCPH